MLAPQAGTQVPALRAGRKCYLASLLREQVMGRHVCCRHLTVLHEGLWFPLWVGSIILSSSNTGQRVIPTPKPTHPQGHVLLICGNPPT